MKVPLSWLKEYLPTQLSDDEIANALTSIGLEFEGAREGVMEVALTPNLSHCASIWGIARELSAVTGEKLHRPKFAVVEKSNEPIEKEVFLEVENKQSCPRYACRLIHGVQVGHSPSWLKERIEASGMRSVNNVVDITNLVLLELGQPLHAFDFQKIEGKKIVVRNARKGESLTALDGKVYHPTEETLLICDAKKPLALAGIMGSLESETTESTSSILLESAYFEPTQIRKSAKRLDVRSEASYRFERGVDPNGILEALERATAWICEIAGGTACKGHLDSRAEVVPPRQIACRLSRINQILGTHLAMSEVETIFRRLNFTLIHSSEDSITVSVPTYRHDLHEEIDLIEEVARLYGYDNIYKKEPPRYRSGLLPHSSEYLLTEKIRDLLRSEGLQECLTCDLISPSQASLISPDIFPSRTLIKLLNPHSSEQSILRPSLLPGLLSVLRYNEDHGIESVSGFEVGRIHFHAKDKYWEPPVAGIILTGEKTPFHWEAKNNLIDFYDLKGIVENLFLALKISTLSFRASAYANFHPGRQSAILLDQKEVGVLGEIHPLTLKEANLKRAVFYAEIDLEEIQRHLSPNIRMEPLPQFPASTRDWTITIQEEVPLDQLLKSCSTEIAPLLESVTLYDIYRSPTIGAGKKNLTLRFVYRDRTKTISQADVEQAHSSLTAKILESLTGKTL